MAEIVPERKVGGRGEIFVVSPGRKKNSDGHCQSGREVIFDRRLDAEQIEVCWGRVDRNSVHRKRQFGESDDFQDEPQSGLVVDHVLHGHPVLDQVSELGENLRIGSRQRFDSRETVGVVQAPVKPEGTDILPDEECPGQGGTAKMGGGQNGDGGKSSPGNRRAEPRGRGKSQKQERCKRRTRRVGILDNPAMLDPDREIVQAPPVERAPSE